MYNIKKLKTLLEILLFFVQQELTYVQKKNQPVDHIVNLNLKVLVSTLNKWCFLSHMEQFFVEHNKLRNYINI
jgi:hypothetical protein